MTSSPASGASAARLRLAIVLPTTEETCTVVADGQARVVAYAPPFPGPAPGRGRGGWH